MKRKPKREPTHRHEMGAGREPTGSAISAKGCGDVLSRRCSLRSRFTIRGCIWRARTDSDPCILSRRPAVKLDVDFVVVEQPQHGGAHSGFGDLRRFGERSRRVGRRCFLFRDIAALLCELLEQPKERLVGFGVGGDLLE